MELVRLETCNVVGMHPELLLRAARTTNDPELEGRARGSSGVRTYAQQRYLYGYYGPGRAANPDYVGAGGRRGSKHMIQSSTYQYPGGFHQGDYGYAIDIGFYGGARPGEWELLRRVAARHGLRLTVFRPFEPWHFELDPRIPEHTFNPKPDPVTIAAETVLEEDDMHYIISRPGAPASMRGFLAVFTGASVTWYDMDTLTAVRDAYEDADRPLTTIPYTEHSFEQLLLGLDLEHLVEEWQVQA